MLDPKRTFFSHTCLGLLLALLGACASDTASSAPPATGCNAGLTRCGQYSCADLAMDGANCGGCGNACNNVCSAGACKDTCDVGLLACGKSCMNVQTDRNNCGACGKSCGGDQSCAAGVCTCPQDATICDNSCANLNTNFNHCGSCSTRCDAGQLCAAGKCSGQAVLWQEPILNEQGKIDPASYAKFAQATDIDTFSRRFGPDYAFYHGSATETFPKVYEQTDRTGLYFDGDCQWTNFDKFWSGAFAGNVLYIPEEASKPGIDRVRFSWLFTDATNKAACFIMRTDINKLADENLWFPQSPDPCVNDPHFVQASGGTPPLHPVALERSHYDWSHAGIVAFPNGVIGATGYGNNDDKFPVVKLDANKVPTAVTVSSNNEFAFVTVWDVATTKGQLAVIALEGRGPFGIHENDVMRYSGLMNMGAYTHMKLLGYVDLPIAAPSSVSVMTNGAVNGSYWGERWATDDNPFPHALLDTQAARDFWANEPPRPKGYRATGGYVMIGSRAENKVVFVDIGPMIQWFRTMYFTTQDRFDKTKNEGDAPDQWPFTFAIAPDAKPVVSTTLDLPNPSVVSAGWQQSEGLEAPYTDYFERAFVGTLKGELHILNVGGWTSGQPVKINEIRTIAVGRNPTGISIGNARNSDNNRNQLIVVSRGDREVSLFTPEGVRLKTLRDERMLDPIQAQTTELNDLRIADFRGKQVLSYLYHNLYIWKMGADGKADWEFTNTFARPGAVFTTSSVLFY